jgi:hypothetical protein
LWLLEELLIVICLVLLATTHLCLEFQAPDPLVQATNHLCLEFLAPSPLVLLAIAHSWPEFLTRYPLVLAPIPS